MESQHLHVFLVVAEELHFGRAAERLRLAQPAVTRQIQQLERDLGASLFDRSSRSVHLTSAGEALIEPAQRVLDAVERIGPVVAAAGTGVIGRVRIGYSGASTRVLIARLVSAVRQRAPGIDLHLHTQTYPRLYSHDFVQPVMSGVLNRDLDIGIGRWDLMPAMVDSRVIATEHLVMAVPRDHRLAGRESLSMRDFRDEPLVSTPQTAGSVTFDRLLKLSYGAGFEPNIVQTAPDMWEALALVATGLGSSLAPESVADTVNDPGVVFVPVADEIAPILLRMAWRHDHHNPTVETVLRLADEVLETHGRP